MLTEEEYAVFNSIKFSLIIISGIMAGKYMLAIYNSFKNTRVLLNFRGVQE